MNKKNIIRVTAAVSAALLFAGAFILTKDDIRQRAKENDMKKYLPKPGVLSALEEISVPEKEVETSENNDIPSGTSTQPEESVVTSQPVLSQEVRQELIDSSAEFANDYPDSLGWLYIPGTAVSYPVMQYSDNDYYLSHAYDGSRLKTGSVFLDHRCESRLKNPINIAYAHNMRNGSMFAQVVDFKDSSFFESHRYGWLATPETVYRIDFFSCAVADWHDELYNGSMPIAQWIPHLLEKSAVRRDMEYSDNDRFISLSTCSYEFTNARTILTGKLVEMED